MKSREWNYRMTAVFLVPAFVVLYALAARHFNGSSTAAGGEIEMADKVVKSKEEWKETLTPEQHNILRECGTERAFTGKYWDHKASGVYTCAGCGQKLFDSDDKFQSGSGWPSFTRPADAGSVSEHTDHNLGMTRTEVKCRRCDGHLGHVFSDGPKPTGMRYCINSAALDFEKKASAPAKQAGDPPELATATFGAGCFWCVEAAFEMLDGVKSVKSGYMGGHVKNPTYEQVCSGRTGHAEVAQVSYDPKRVSFEGLLEVFWLVHDPTTLNRQGVDVGTQYRSAIFYHSPEQKAAAKKSKRALDESGKFRNPVVTEIVAASEFYEAEKYHQDYFRNNSDAPYCKAVIAPKLKKVRAATREAGRR